MMKTIDDLIWDTLDKKQSDIALGFLRYEALRRLKPIEFRALWHRNMKGENFDEMVNELILNNQKL